MRQNRHFAQLSKPKQYMLLLLLPVFAFLLLLALKTLYAETVMQYIPPCMLRTLTGWLCPSCGMTHSVFALARLDLLTAARENLMIPLAVLFALLWYIERWFSVSGHPRRLLPRKGKFWIGVLLFWLIYTILRNIVHI